MQKFKHRSIFYFLLGAVVSFLFSTGIQIIYIQYQKIQKAHQVKMAQLENFNNSIRDIKARINEKKQHMEQFEAAIGKLSLINQSFEGFCEEGKTIEDSKWIEWIEKKNKAYINYLTAATPLATTFNVEIFKKAEAFSKLGSEATCDQNILASTKQAKLKEKELILALRNDIASDINLLNQKIEQRKKFQLVGLKK